MELSQVLTEDQRKERFSHSLQQKRAHKQMAEEADDSPGSSTSTAGGFSGSVVVTAKAPKLETRTLLQKFLDGRKSENQPKVGFDSHVSEAPIQCTEQQEFKRKVEGSMKVRTDLLTQYESNQESAKKSSPRSPTSTSIYQGPNEIYPYPGLVRHQTVIQPPQMWPNLIWGLYGWPSKRCSSPNLFVQNDIPRPPFKELSTTEPDTTTPTEKLDEKSLQKVCDKDQPELKLSDEKDKNIVRVYIHKKFRRTESSSSYQPPPRPSVIVSPKMSKEEKKMIEVDEDFDDILTTGSFSDVSDISDWCNVSDTSEEELLDITSICELYFSDESTCTHLKATQKDFFAEWTLIPLGEEMMVTYIDFCKGNIKMIGFPWMAIASSVVR